MCVECLYSLGGSLHCSEHTTPHQLWPLQTASQMFLLVKSVNPCLAACRTSEGHVLHAYRHDLQTAPAYTKYSGSRSVCNNTNSNTSILHNTR